MIGERADALAGEVLGEPLGAVARGGVDDAALAPMARRGNRSICARGLSLAAKRRSRFGRSKLWTMVRGGSREKLRRRCRAASRASAVAVSAIDRHAAERLAERRRAPGIRDGSRGPIARRSAPRRWRGGVTPARLSRAAKAAIGERARARRRGGGACPRRAGARPRRSRSSVDELKRRRGDAEAPHLLDLVAHQRDQRRDDERQPAVEHRGQLVAERLAAAGRHDGEDVLAGEHRRDDLRLAGAETVVAEDGLQRRPARAWRHRSWEGIASVTQCLSPRGSTTAGRCLLSQGTRLAP